MIHEIINQARTAAYLANSALGIPGIMACDVTNDGGCATYPAMPQCFESGGWITTPGASGNGVVVADTAALDVTGDITVVVAFKLDDPTPTGSIVLVGKGATYRIGMTSAGLLTFAWTNAGGTPITRTGDEDFRPYMAGGTIPYLAATLDVDNGAAGHDVRWWRSWTGAAGSWTQVGSTSTTAGTTTIQNSTNDFYIGASTNTDQVQGQWHYAGVDNAIGVGGLPSTSTYNFEFIGFADLEGVAAGATSFTASTGQTVTVNHSGGTPTSIEPYVPADTWIDLTFTTPAADEAPWYSADYPASADALGFYVEEWTGLDDGHVSRVVTSVGPYRSGAMLGSLSNAERVMALNVFLLARSEEAMDYLFNWLSAALASACNECSGDRMLTRRFCGDVGDLWNGVVEMRNVGLVKGLTWEANVVEEGSCYIRRASFTLTAGDPAMYLPQVTPAVTADPTDLGGSLLNEQYALDRRPCRPSCSELEAASRATYTFDIGTAMGMIGAVVTFANTSTEHSFPFRAILYYDPGAIGVTPNPCGLLRACEIYVRPLPPSSQLRWDIPGRRVEYRDPTTGVFVSGYPYLDANDPPIPRFGMSACGQHHLVIEPATLCIERIGGTGNVFEFEGIIFNDPQFPDVEVILQERIGFA
jgi:hypothetical protein